MACCPVVAARSGFRAPSVVTAHWRSSSPAPTTTHPPPKRWGWVTRALPDAELDAFVDAIVARLASFDCTSLASAKAMVNRAVLPQDADLIAAYSEFAHSLTLPGFLSRATGFQALFAEAGIDVEYRLGSTSASPTSGADTSHHE